MCSFAYVLQREAIAAKALTEMTLAPYAKEGASVPTPESAVAEFDDWLDDRPDVLDKPWAELELHDLLFARR